MSTVDLPYLTIPTTGLDVWLTFRADAALNTASACVQRIKSGTGQPLEEWNKLQFAVSGAAAAASTFTELHPEVEARQAGESVLARIDEYLTEVSLDAELFNAFSSLPTDGLEPLAKRLLDETLRDFRRSGVDRDEATRERIAEISRRMVAVSQEFARNIRDDVRHIWVEDVSGMPADWLADHEITDGQIKVTTDYPDAVPFFTFSENPTAREELRREFLTCGWPANEKVLTELFALRAEYANLLGYATWADYEAEVKMIGTGDAIATFIDSVVDRARPSAQRDYDMLLQRVQADHPEATTVSLADKDYYVEAIRRESYGVDSAQVRQYFQFDRVIQGVLEATKKLFEIEFHQVTAPVWHEDVLVYDVFLKDRPLGRAYLDLHPRAGKFGHAAQFTLVDGIQGWALPEGVLGCNFGRDLLDHDDVVTLFHEFGHLLHHLLAGHGKYAEFAGVATEWDFVEAPSQMLEEWAWDPTVLATFAINAEGETIPADLVTKMRAAQDFGKGFDALTQMFYAQLSYTYHTQECEDLTAHLIELQSKYSMFPYLPGTHMMASFGHLDGYGAGYYTYMWSLVIAKDMFSRFEADLFDEVVAAEYRDGVLAQGGNKDAADLVSTFLGREYNLDAFTRWLQTPLQQ